MKRIGMYGGAFDPPHNAHVALARAAVEQLQLDELLVMPTGNAWHKSSTLSPAAHRLALARIAFESLPRTAVDDREMRRDGPTYTVDTLRELRSEHPDAQLFLVMGEDQAAMLTRWREWQEVIRLATLCVAPRPNAEAHSSLQPDGLPPEVRVQRLAMPAMEDNATDIRRRVAAGNGRVEGILHLVPPGVARYIAAHHLYEAEAH